ncbi:type II secretion system protein GspE [Buttiauxella warmboldiae]|uniref:Type II secretion system protein E n=1 Tax=Buttiauxella warmboldiae TaxID=82993 RepID=A0A3N5DM10_9ENTR|nr:type II secretion system ATPase GspE [Buttiauxella warmboldiae]RPH29618.1 type II secretion system protein GspE [Buttiauxella warmboldiae]
MSDKIELDYSFARTHQVIAEGNHLYITGDTSLETLLDMRRRIGAQVLIQQLDVSEFNERVKQFYESHNRISQEMVDSLDEHIDLMALTEYVDENAEQLDSDTSAPVIRLINAILSEAIRESASDIHIETFERSLLVRFRCDGELRTILEPARRLAPLLISRIKVMARLDIAEKRLPQDGRISLRIGQRNVDVRVSTLPSRHGERAVLRLLDKSELRLDLEHMGMPATEVLQVKKLIQKPHGILLVTGPTGSGKSTTLYGLLSLMDHTTRNIMTIEDPVEYELEGIGQTQVNTRIEMTFARGLRAILRQDPDVVMVGEIRDTETAQIAIQASLTGHLVLSTLHTNSAAGAITRLRDMGVEPFLLSSSLLGVIAQRLVRKLCTECRQQRPLEKSECAWFSHFLQPVTHIWHAVGCEACRYTGYKGRVAIHEHLSIDKELQIAIYQGQHENIFASKVVSLRSRGLECVVEGVTSLEEVLRVTSDSGNEEA